MRVRIDEARHDDLACRVYRPCWLKSSSQGSRHPCLNDLAVVYCYCSVFDEAKSTKRVAALRPAGDGQELGSGVD
jgi:hypothetical protein